MRTHNSLTNRVGNLIFRSWLACMSVILPSCEEWTPQADGYFVVDGKEYKIHVMTLTKEAITSQNAYLMHLGFQGAPYVNSSSTVYTSSSSLAGGTYHYIPPKGNPWQPNQLTGLGFRTNASASYDMDANSVGDLTVSVNGKFYTVDFNGQVQGHSFVIHYSGLIAQLAF